MRTAIVFAITMLASLLTLTTDMYSTRPSQVTISSASLYDEDRVLLDEFIATLNPEIMKTCTDRHDAGGAIDLVYLANCGDFDLDARYMRIPKFQAVKKFEYVMLYSSSRLEFEERLAR